VPAAISRFKSRLVRRSPALRNAILFGADALNFHPAVPARAWTGDPAEFAYFIEKERAAIGQGY